MQSPSHVASTHNQDQLLLNIPIVCRSHLFYPFKNYENRPEIENYVNFWNLPWDKYSSHQLSSFTITTIVRAVYNSYLHEFRDVCRNHTLKKNVRRMITSKDSILYFLCSKDLGGNCSGSAKSPIHIKTHYNGIKIKMWHIDHKPNLRARNVPQSKGQSRCLVWLILYTWGTPLCCKP
jgi:hypothetical protein